MPAAAALVCFERLFKKLWLLFTRMLLRAAPELFPQKAEREGSKDDHVWHDRLPVAQHCPDQYVGAGILQDQKAYKQSFAPVLERQKHPRRPEQYHRRYSEQTYYYVLPRIRPL